MSNPRIVIVGAGFGGIAAAIELQKHGFDELTLLEAAPEIGGTWFHNTYPGAACDVPSQLYSFSFAQRRDWPRLCPRQEEILVYLRQVARDFGVAEQVVCGTRVSACRWSDADQAWTVATRSGATYTADALILATGQLHQPSFPRVEGAESFAGHSFHSARWDHDYPLAGKRVAVVGTGASAVQFVPEIVEEVAHLTVFQRTGNWFMPRKNRPYPRVVRAAVQTVPGLQSARRAFWFHYGELLTFAIRHPGTVGKVVHQASTAFMRWQLEDPVVREQVWPDYTFGCKRVLFGSNFLPALQREHVELVTDAVAGMAREGVVTADGRLHPVDCVIWGTGFKTNDFMFPMEITGSEGRSLREVWAGGAPRPPRPHRSRISLDVRHVRAEHEHLRRLDHHLPGGAGPLRPPSPAGAAPPRSGRDRRPSRGRGRQRPRAPSSLRRHRLDAVRLVVPRRQRPHRRQLAGLHARVPQGHRDPRSW